MFYVSTVHILSTIFTMNQNWALNSPNNVTLFQRRLFNNPNKTLNKKLSETERAEIDWRAVLDLLLE